MTTFDDREKAFENKFQHDADLLFRIRARRDRLAGEWAADLMGLSGAEAEAYARQAEVIWGDVDVLLTPTAPTTYTIAEVLADPVALNANLGLYTNFVNLLDMSAIAVPAGWRANGTGFGVTLVGPAWSDAALLDLARRYAAVALMPEAPPLDLGGQVVSQPCVG